MRKTSAKKSLLDAYQFDGFKTSSAVKGKLGDKNARVLSLSRRSKKVSAINAADCIAAITTVNPSSLATFRAVIDAFTLSLRSGGYSVKKLA
jgi:hypothetical protein